MKPIFKEEPIVDRVLNLMEGCEAEGMKLEAIEITYDEAADFAFELNVAIGEDVMLAEDINGTLVNGVEIIVEDK